MILHAVNGFSDLLTTYPWPGLRRTIREPLPPLSTNHTRLLVIGRRYADIHTPVTRHWTPVVTLRTPFTPHETPCSALGVPCFRCHLPPPPIATLCEVTPARGSDITAHEACSRLICLQQHANYSTAQRCILLVLQLALRSLVNICTTRWKQKNVTLTFRLKAGSTQACWSCYAQRRKASELVRLRSCVIVHRHAHERFLNIRNRLVCTKQPHAHDAIGQSCTVINAQKGVLARSSVLHMVVV